LQQLKQVWRATALRPAVRSSHKAAPNPALAAAAAATSYTSAAGVTPQVTIFIFLIIFKLILIIIPPQPPLCTQLLLHALQRSTL
jgi:hypothetical protein